MTSSATPTTQPCRCCGAWFPPSCWAASRAAASTTTTRSSRNSRELTESPHSRRRWALRTVRLALGVAGATAMAALVAIAPATASVPKTASKTAAGKVTAAAAAAPATTFGVPRIVDPIHTYGEPDIKIAPNGDVHVSGPAGTGVQRSIWNVSKDGGDSWRVVNGIPATPLDQTQLQLAKTTPGPGGGDTELAIARNGKVFYNDLYTLTCFTAATSSDAGATVQTNPL